jgi:hypothetical protein
MSRKDAIVLASRTLAVLLTVWALGSLSALPETVYSFVRYVNLEPGSSNYVQYWRHHYLIELGFLVTRIIGYSLMARWLYRGGSEIEELLLPLAAEENSR